MEELIEGPTAGDLWAGAQGNRVRRRMVQSTLFPHGEKEKDCNGDDFKQKEDGDEGKDDEEEDDWCSNGKKKRKSAKRKTNSQRNPKGTLQSRGSKKVAGNGKDAMKKVSDGDSPVIIKSDFFLSISERQHQKRQQEEQIHDISPDGKNSSVSPNSTTNTRTPQTQKQQTKFMLEKQQMKATTRPQEKVMNNGSTEAVFNRIPSDFFPDEPTLQFIPNLRSEAKMMAEENSRLFSGRPIHPFFSSWKASKKNQEKNEFESTCCSFEPREGGITFNPVHVFETVKDDVSSLDWRHWQFSERSSLNGSSDLCSKSTPVFKRSVNSLQFDDFSSGCHPSCTSICQNEISLDGCPVASNEEPGINRVDSGRPFSSCLNSSNAEWQGKFLQQGSCDEPKNSLWIDKYQPRKAAQVCGNSEAVKFISEWLCLWREKGSQTSKSFFNNENVAAQDVDCSFNQSDYDSENSDEETSLKNVLLVSGPVGSGKSAAIYACAEEQGFQVIEVNASDWRNGALVKQRFGEALESHWLQHKVDSTANSEKKPPLKFSLQGNKVNQGSKTEVAELVTLSDEEDSQQCGTPSKLTGMENGVTNDQNEIKTLILFEDVDATLCEDHGFLSTIQQLAVTAKRPMILTANKHNPVLPNNLDRLEVPFAMPPSKELLGLGHVICAAEQAEVHPFLMDRFIEYFQGDIRKTIMHLQFWCQGQNVRKGYRPQITYSPLLFDPEAGYRILPKLLPWGYPSRLSELVEEEITKSLKMMGESNSSVELVVEETQDTSRMYPASDCMKSKKEEMLSLNCCLQSEDILFSHPECNHDLSGTSGSPVAFARRNLRRKFDAVVSSDSEKDNTVDNPFHFGSPLADSNDKTQGAKTSPSNCFPLEGYCYPSTERLSCLEGCEMEQNCYEFSETAVYPHMDGTCNSVDISSVPESVFVPETEVDSESGLYSATVSYSPLFCMEADSMSNSLSPNKLFTKGEKLCNPLNMSPEMLGSDTDVYKTPLHVEVVVDSHIECVQDVVKGHQMFDECSHFDFARGAQTLENPGLYRQTNTVEETWKGLRECRNNIQLHVNSEEEDASQALNLASEMSNLISEADLLLSDCQPYIYDFVEQSMLSCEKSHSYRWYDNQLQMSSIISQHGLCFYAKESFALQSNRGSGDRLDLAWQMLTSSTNAIALGKLLSLDKSIKEIEIPISYSSLRRQRDFSLCSIVQSVVPSRAYLALQGGAFHEYCSSLCQISRLEVTRLSECVRLRKQRRSRAAQHYLSSGPFTLSPEDISSLSQYNCYGKISSQSRD